MNRARRDLLLGGLVALGAAWALWHLGSPPAPRLRPSEIDGWIDRVGSDTAVLAVLRVAAIVWIVRLGLGCLWLAACTSGRVANRSVAGAGTTGVGRERAAGALALWIVRRGTAAVVSVSTIVAATAPPPASATTASGEARSEETATLRVIALDSIAGPGDRGSSSGDDTANPDIGSPVTLPGAHPTPAGEEWVVAPGDHLWAIATETVADGRGRDPRLREVDRYWRRLVAANRDRLVVPGNADLLYPGQRLRLPRLPNARLSRPGRR